MRISSLLTALLIFCHIGAAQAQATVAGIIKNEVSAIPTATVSLLTSDSNWLRSVLADDNGRFIMDKVPVGNYIVTATAMGYTTAMQIIAVKDSTPLSISLLLQKKTNSLKEVAVSGKKSFIEVGLGKTVVNVDASPTAAGSNVLELLRRSPGIIVDQNGNISMNGKQDVLVLIDDRPTYLSAEQLADYLKTISANEVSQLELITQPSAKYDAAGNAGVINIKRKKNRNKGLNGTATLSYRQFNYATVTGNFLLNYKKDKLNLSLSGGDHEATGFADYTEDLYVTNPSTGVVSYTHVHSHPIERFSIANLQLTADYDLTNKATIGTSVRYDYHTNTMRDNVYATTTSPATPTAYNNIVNPDGFIRKDVIANAYYKKEIKKDDELSINFDYLSYLNSPHQSIANTNYDADMQPLPNALYLRSTQPTLINVYSTKIDRSLTLKDGISIEAGLKSSYITTDNNSQFSIQQNKVWLSDTTRSNDFTYKENINAAYLSAKKSLGDKWQTQAGLRAENTNEQGVQMVHNEQFNKSYTSLFPTAYVSYKLNADNQFELNYGRRIDRPDYQSLNPFIYYSFQYYYTVGNPYLQPQFTNTLELKHSYKNTIITMLGYARTTNVINQLFEVNDTTNTAISTQKNIGVNTQAYAVLMFNKDVAKWCSINASAMLFYADYNGMIDTTHTDKNGWGYTANITAQFDFRKGWKGEIVSYYVGSYVQSLISTFTPVLYLSLGASKKINDRMTVKLSVNDPFYTNRNGNENAYTGYSMKTVYRYDTRGGMVTFNYNFGAAQKSKHEADVPDETKRMKMN